MSASRSNPAWVPIVIIAWFIVLIGASIGLLATGVMPGAASVALAGSLVLLPVSLLMAMRGRGSGGGEDFGRLSAAITAMVQEGGLSEGAKRVLHRREERELLRRAIEQDITDEDWDAATVLVKELAEQFGYRADAEEFRTRIERARAQTMDRHVVDALVELDDLIRGQQWAESYAEAARIQRLYPESHRVDGLRERVDQAHLRYRKELERRFLVAADREEIDEAMALLKELDAYLTPTEAAPFQEVARGVISKSRENLGVRFKLCVQDHHWAEAVAVGQQIIADFPNSRMADEVRGMLPVLRDKAGAVGGAPAAG